MTARHRLTGEAAAKIRVWFEGMGQSPNKPYGVKRFYEERWARVPGELLEPDRERWAISTENGDTPDCEV